MSSLSKGPIFSAISRISGIVISLPLILDPALLLLTRQLPLILV